MSSIPGGSPLPPSAGGASGAGQAGGGENAATAQGVGGRTPDVGGGQAGGASSAGQAGAAYTGGRRDPNDPVSGYADAIVSVASAEGVLDRVESELYSFAQAAEAHQELSRRLSDPAVEISTKDAVVNDLLQAAHPQTIAAVSYIIAGGRARQLGAIAHAVVEKAAERRDSALAEVRTAVPLDDAQKQRLVAALSAQARRPIDLKVTVDPSIVGGIVVTMGDTVIDGSIARRISDVRARMVGA